MDVHTRLCQNSLYFLLTLQLASKHLKLGPISAKFLPPLHRRSCIRCSLFYPVRLQTKPKSYDSLSWTFIQRWNNLLATQFSFYVILLDRIRSQCICINYYLSTISFGAIFLIRTWQLMQCLAVFNIRERNCYQSKFIFKRSKSMVLSIISCN